MQTTNAYGSSSTLTISYYAPLTEAAAMTDCSDFATFIGTSGSGVFTPN